MKVLILLILISFLCAEETQEQFKNVSTVNLLTNAGKDDELWREFEINKRIRSGKDKDIVYKFMTDEKVDAKIRYLAMRSFDRTGDIDELKYVIEEIKKPNAFKNPLYFAIFSNGNPQWFELANELIPMAEIDKNSRNLSTASAADTFLRYIRKQGLDKTRHQAFSALSQHLDKTSPCKIKSIDGSDGIFLFTVINDNGRIEYYDVKLIGDSWEIQKQP